MGTMDTYRQAFVVGTANFDGSLKGLSNIFEISKFAVGSDSSPQQAVARAKDAASKAAAVWTACRAEDFYVFQGYASRCDAVANRGKFTRV